MLQNQVATVDRRWLLPVVAIATVGILLSAWRWQIVLRLLRLRRGYGELLLRYWGGSFYNMVLPGSVGGDVLRIGGLARTGVPAATAVVSVLADRIAGLWFGLLIGFVSSLSGTTLPYQAVLQLVFGGSIIGGIALVLLGPTILVHLPLLKHGAPLLRCLRQPCAIGWLVITLVFQFLVIIEVMLIARMVHVPLPLVICGLYTPVVFLTTLLPVSLNGVGIREATFVVLLGGVGVAPELAALIGLVWYLVSLLTSLPGGLAPVLLMRHETPPLAAQ